MSVEDAYLYMVIVAFAVFGLTLFGVAVWQQSKK